MNVFFYFSESIFFRVAFIILTSLLNSIAVTCIYADPLALTNDEISRIDDFVETIPVEKGVGQFFMINLPINYIGSFDRKNWKGKNDKTPIHKKLIEKEGFGSIILKDSNFHYLNKLANFEEERIGLITEFVNNLQYRAISKENKGVKIPLFIAADFEGPSINSIGNTLTLPPPALTLGNTQDSRLIEKTGRIVGYQLASSGINMILGPVLDIDKTKQGVYNTVLRNRSFSSDPEGVSNLATYYIKGLREAGVTVIGKHFPGLGAIKDNPHYHVTSFDGNKKDLKEHLKPYYALNKLLNGVMTSHVSIPFFNKNSQKIPATFSKSVIRFIRGEETFKPFKRMMYNNKLVISDDLGMKAITIYAKNNGQTYSDMAIDTFEAGHDLLMFSKVVTDEDYQNHPQKGALPISKLIKIKKDLLLYLKRDENKEKYLSSLKRIIHMKAASYKLQGGNINNFIKEKLNKVNRSRLSVPNSVRGTDGFLSHEKLNKEYTSIIEKSYLILQGSLSEISSKEKVACVFSKKEHHNNYEGIKTSFKKLYQSASPYTGKFKKRIDESRKFIIEKGCQKVFFVVDSNANLQRVINIIEVLKSNRIDLILLMHQTPMSLSNKILNYEYLTIMGAFTKHKISYNTDVKIIKGDIVAGQLNQLTISYKDQNPELDRIAKPDISKIKLNYSLRASDFHKIKKQLVIQSNTIQSLKTQIEILQRDNLNAADLNKKLLTLKNQKDQQDKDLNDFSKNIDDALMNAYGKKTITINEDILPQTSYSEKTKLKNILKNTKGRQGRLTIGFALKEINKKIDNQEDIPPIKKMYIKSLAYLNIREKPSAQILPRYPIYSLKEKGFYSEILLVLMSITGILIIMYVTDKAKSEISNETNITSATSLLLKKVLASPLLILIIMLFIIMVFMYIAHINELSLHELFQKYMNKPIGKG